MARQERGRIHHKVSGGPRGRPRRRIRLARPTGALLCLRASAADAPGTPRSAGAAGGARFTRGNFLERHGCNSWMVGLVVAGVGEDGGSAFLAGYARRDYGVKGSAVY